MLKNKKGPKANCFAFGGQFLYERCLPEGEPRDEKLHWGRREAATFKLLCFWRGQSQLLDSDGRSSNSSSNCVKERTGFCKTAEGKSFYKAGNKLSAVF